MNKIRIRIEGTEKSRRGLKKMYDNECCTSLKMDRPEMEYLDYVLKKKGLKKSTLIKTLINDWLDSVGM